MIASGTDTLVGITEYDFDLVLFSFSYIRSLENTSQLTSKQLTRLDSINTYLQEVLTLERKKQAHQDSIIVNLESVIKQHERRYKRFSIGVHGNASLMSDFRFEYRPLFGVGLQLGIDRGYFGVDYGFNGQHFIGLRGGYNIIKF